MVTGTTSPFSSTESIDLNSPAALEVGFATFLESLFEIKGVSTIQKALLCQAAEHEYCNVLCGIKDQFISSCGRKDCALLIDCRINKPTAVAFHDLNVVIVECNSNVKHELNGGEYKERVLQCQTAVKALQTHGHPGMMHLRDASYAEAGKLMLESHESLRDDYEVSTPELNRLVETARGCEDVFSADMTGDFDHCIVALAQQQHAQNFMATLDSSARQPKPKN
ncbi:hypothetical protein PR003_g18910 [Phytophthora rubi]|uniref:GHMP kinase C-terminal domain-containing protein n=1 Tax=Phytophthora rubi TaxID=129364 RepID=A0A6A4DZZ8_9STRA|nr:hypothetical protein PR003_g18910 [Phytophthora rubi]